MRKLLIILSVANCTLAVVSFTGKVAERLNPDLYVSAFGTFIGVAILGFLLTWACALVVAIAYGLISADLKPVGERSMYCRSCGYMLIGLPENRCPECWCPFDPQDVRTYRRYPKGAGKGVLVLVCCWLAASGVAFVFLVVGVLRFVYAR